MIGNINHIAIAVPDVEAAATRWRSALGASVSAPQD
ncbi:MAG TPA: methylmalonyl-CoA epimerase, partial [Alphaproteobacteria bacterium]|nr:methylmalonyl-CoA epimerase [Alphaproteobacteria bacterium]